MRVLDPCRVLGESNVATISHNGTGKHDVVVIPDLETCGDPDSRLRWASKHTAPGGKVYVTTRQGGHVAGRRRTWRSDNLAALLLEHGELEEFGVDESGRILASYTPATKKGSIVVWTGYAIGPWHPLDIVQKGLGGSETAAWRISEHLAQRGYQVTLYGHFQQQGAVQQVLLKDWRTFDPTRPHDAVIAFRDARLFDERLNTEQAFLWLEDVAGAEQLTPERAARITQICTVSEWHRQNMLERYDWLDHSQVTACRNGITPAFFAGDPPERELRVLYTSSPDRGLDIVLECWPAIRACVPGARLVHCYSRWYDLVADGNPMIAAHRARVRELSEHPGVEHIEAQGQRDLAMLMRSSTAWVHPSYFSPGGEPFNETSCISAMEAQAAGLRVVCGNRGALSETVQTGLKIDGDPMTEEWREQFVSGVVSALTDEKVQEVAQSEGPRLMAERSWAGAVDQLQALFR